MRIFKNKWFNRWARGENITDTVLFDSANEIVQGKVEADLGGYLFKKRLPQAGKGKSGGYRVIVGYRKENTGRLVFLYAFRKSDKENISTQEEAALSLAAKSFLSATDRQIEKLIEARSIWEVKRNEKE